MCMGSSLVRFDHEDGLIRNFSIGQVCSVGFYCSYSSVQLGSLHIVICKYDLRLQSATQVIIVSTKLHHGL